MNKKILAGICLVAVLLIGGIVAFALGNNDSGSAGEQSSATSPTGSAASPSAGATQNAEAPTTGVPVFPTPSLPAGSEDAKTALAINQIIFEVTQEALNRPKDQRMTAEEINARIQSRIEELKKEGGN